MSWKWPTEPTQGNCGATILGPHNIPLASLVHGTPVQVQAKQQVMERACPNVQGHH